MADNPKEVFELLKGILKKARNKTKTDLEELKKYFHLKELNSYDSAYYLRILREKKYEVDEKELKKYFEFESVLDYLYRFVERFYGIEIRQMNTKTYDKDVRIYEIFKGKKLLAYYFLDTFYRKGKRH
jgi:Zn-dependent oligopeptidase